MLEHKLYNRCHQEPVPLISAKRPPTEPINNLNITPVGLKGVQAWGSDMGIGLTSDGRCNIEGNAMVDNRG